MDIEPVISRVRAAAARVTEAADAVEAAKGALQREALRALVDAEEEQTTWELARRLYWDVPELPTKIIETVLGTRTRVYKLVGPGPVIGACVDCGAEIRATSRTHRESGASVCRGCEDARRKAEEEEERRAGWYGGHDPGPESDDDWWLVEPPDEPPPEPFDEAACPCCG